MSYGVQPSGASQGDTVTSSWWARSNLPGTKAVNYYTYWGSGYSSNSVNFYPTQEWQKFTHTWTASNTYNFIQYWFQGAHTTPWWFEVADLQTEINKSYSTPYVLPATDRSSTNGWVDISGNDNHGTLTNMVGTGATHYRAGRGITGGTIMPVSTSYLNFDGSDDYVNCGSSPITSNSVFSWEAWIYPSTTGTPFFMGTNSSGQAMVSYWDSANNKVRVGVWGSDKLTSSTAISGGWGHTCWTWDGTTLRAYTNGVADGTATGFSFNIASNYIMVGSAPAAQRFGGKIGTVKLYNKVLTAAEVLSNYNATKGRFL